MVYLRLLVHRENPWNRRSLFGPCRVMIPTYLPTYRQSKQHLSKPTVFAAVRAICIDSRSAAEFSWEGAIYVQVAPSIPMSRIGVHAANKTR
jgi:hypothetical protein